MKPFVFVAGMFRCGSTLMARMLNANAAITCASDTFQPVFKALRNQAADEAGLEIEHGAPFDDYYFYDVPQRVRKAVAGFDPQSSVKGPGIDDMRQAIVRYSADFSPKLSDSISLLGGDTYRDLLASGLDCIEKAYGTEKTQLLGYKVTWSSEFVPHVLSSFPQAKAIEIVRDPRGVCCSKFSTEVKYPWLFLIRHWRKHASLAWSNATDPDFGDRVKIIRYEDLVGNPRETIPAMCDFLGVPFDERMLAPGSYDDGSGKNWTGNSSHFEKQDALSSQSVERWQKLMTDAEVAQIEHFCGPEMRLLGYRPSAAAERVSALNLAADAPVIGAEHLPKWILPQDFRGDALRREIAMENWRLACLENGDALGTAAKEAAALSERVFDALAAKTTYLQP